MIDTNVLYHFGPFCDSLSRETKQHLHIRIPEVVRLEMDNHQKRLKLKQLAKKGLKKYHSWIDSHNCKAQRLNLYNHLGGDVKDMDGKILKYCHHLQNFVFKNVVLVTNDEHFYNRAIKNENLMGFNPKDGYESFYEKFISEFT